MGDVELLQKGVYYSDAETWEKAAVAEDGDEPKSEPEAKKSKAGAKKTEKEAAGEGAVLYEDPPDQKTSPSGKSATLKICSWNVDGLRAWIKKKV